MTYSLCPPAHFFPNFQKHCHHEMPMLTYNTVRNLPFNKLHGFFCQSLSKVLIGQWLLDNLMVPH